ncbi:MAG: GxxExxY protein [Xanthomonadaceae bacterium]|nr:GxxExxY protein [Xanthomonadaceae bacterium]
MGQKLSELVIGCAMSVSRDLGHGFLERVYEAALAIEMDEANVSYERQRGVAVRYRGRVVGEYVCDFIVDGRLLLELKALTTTTREHEAQVMNYLKATGLTVALLLNFGAPKLGVRRIVHNHDDTRPI